MINSIKNLLETFRFKIYLAFFITFVLYLVIYYHDTIETLNILTLRANYRVGVIERDLDIQIANANYIIYGISTSLKNQNLKKDNLYISELTANFFPQHIYHATPFRSIKIIDYNDQVIFNSQIPRHMGSVLKKLKPNKYLIGSNQIAFKLAISNIFWGDNSKKEILPLCMSITNNNNEYAGAVCANLYIEKMLNSYKNVQSFTSLYNYIWLLNWNEIDDQTSLKSAEEIFTLKNLFKSWFNNQPLIVDRLMDNYPILIRMEVNYNYLNRELVLDAFYSFVYFAISIIFGSYLLFITKRAYQNKLNTVGEKAFALQRKITLKSTYKTALLKNFSPEQLAELMETIINYVNSLYDKFESQNNRQPQAELRDSILNIVLTEHHYYAFNKVKKTSSFYLEQLRKLTNEKAKKLILPIFLREVIEYCAEYYSDLNISMQVSEKDYKAFNFKHAALAETIFHIFGVITRIGKFDPDADLLVKAIFNNKNIFPTIYIEAILSESSIQPVGLSSGGIAYIYSGLLPVYLLAKENNLLFNIEHKNQKLIFSLKPIADKRLQSLDNPYSSVR